MLGLFTMETAKGFIDPGRQSDGKMHILSKANCPNYRGKQNVEAIQFKGEIYYRVIKDILQDTEIFVRYGEDYETELGIDPATANTYKGKEDHTSVAVPCYKCDIIFASEDLLQLHLYPASGLKSMCSGLVEERRVAKEGGKYPCHFCPEYFTCTKILTAHINNCHDGKKPFMCNICNKTFISRSGLACHKLSKHEKRTFCIYNGCNKEFGQRGHMMSNDSLQYGPHESQGFQMSHMRCYIWGKWQTTAAHSGCS